VISTYAVAGLLAKATARLRDAGVDSAAADARTLLAHCCGTEPRELVGREVSEAQSAEFDRLVTRRAQRVPLQHLTGRAHFRYLELAVGPGVFVPRPETEVMTGWAVDWLRELVHAGRQPLAVDLGTGSGAIAKALATEVPVATVHAVEVSEDALPWARRNLAGTTVTLHPDDLGHALPELAGGVDLVIANPPYIPLEAFASVALEARDHDPTVALFSGVDGLDAIRRVVATATRLLRPGGQLAVEHAEVQADSVPDLLVRTDSFDQVRDHLDLTGRPRFTTGRRLAGWAG
jgi:release factor glutamine methyltransferase